MPLPIYDVAIVPVLAGLAALESYLDRIEEFAAKRGIDPLVLVNARLAPDMYPFAGQIQRATDSAKGTVQRLTGIAAPSFPDDEVTVADLRARIAKTVAFIRSVPKEAYTGGEDRAVELKFGALSKRLRGADYATAFLLPNVLFHVATAHAILRHNGVTIGKLNYLSPFLAATPELPSDVPA